VAATNAKVDQNYEGVKLAVTDDSNGFTEPLLVEPILDYLEIDLVFVATHADSALTAKEDENFESVSQAYDDTNLVAKPLKVNASTGRLILDLTF
jgi:hypothetical protein